MNLTEMRALVRRDLHDEDAANYRWTNDEIDRAIERAVNELSLAIPYEQKATIATTEDSREIDISSLSNRVMIEAVECPVDKFPKSYQRFAIWEDTLTILSDDVPDGSNCYVYYGKLHTLNESTSTIPSRHDRLVTLGAGGYALVQWAAYAIDKVSLGGMPTPREFRAEGERRLSQFRRELKKLGRANKVRIARLYRNVEDV